MENRKGSKPIIRFKPFENHHRNGGKTWVWDVCAEKNIGGENVDSVSTDEIRWFKYYKLFMCSDSVPSFKTESEIEKKKCKPDPSVLRYHTIEMDPQFRRMYDSNGVSVDEIRLNAYQKKEEVKFEPGGYPDNMKHNSKNNSDHTVTVPSNWNNGQVGNRNPQEVNNNNHTLLSNGNSCIARERPNVNRYLYEGRLQENNMVRHIKRMKQWNRSSNSGRGSGSGRKGKKRKNRIFGDFGRKT